MIEHDEHDEETLKDAPLIDDEHHSRPSYPRPGGEGEIPLEHDTAHHAVHREAMLDYYNDPPEYDSRPGAGEL